jgi:hypothetical protein
VHGELQILHGVHGQMSLTYIHVRILGALLQKRPTMTGLSLRRYVVVTDCFSEILKEF